MARTPTRIELLSLRTSRQHLELSTSLLQLVPMETPLLAIVCLQLLKNMVIMVSSLLLYHEMMPPRRQLYSICLSRSWTFYLAYYERWSSHAWSASKPPSHFSKPSTMHIFIAHSRSHRLFLSWLIRLDPAVVNSLRTMHLGSNLEQTEADATKPESSNRYHRAERRLDPTRGELVEPHSPHNVGGSGSHHRRRRISSPRSTASSGRRDEILTSPSWRRGGSRFVRQSGGNVEDPFVSRTSVDQTNQENEGQNAEGVAGPATPGTSGLNSRKNCMADEVLQAAETFLPREDRAGLPLSAETAQAILPPNACVFVAKYVSSLDLFAC